MARPPQSPSGAGRLVSVRLAPDDELLIQLAAQLEGQNVSELLRRASVGLAVELLRRHPESPDLLARAQAMLADAQAAGEPRSVLNVVQELFRQAGDGDSAALRTTGTMI